MEEENDVRAEKNGFSETISGITISRRSVLSSDGGGRQGGMTGVPQCCNFVCLKP